MRRACAWLAVSALACAAGFVCAQTYPSKPVRVIVQYPPGGTPDIYGRVMATELGKLWNQSVVVENRVGASGTIGTDFVAKAAPDGYTLLFAGDGPITVIPNLVAKLPYDSVRDLAPIVNVAQGGFVLLVNPAVAANNMKDLVAWIRSQPGKVSFASSGNGSQQHLSMEWIRTMAGGLDMIHVPYKGFGQGLADVLAGQVPMIFSGPTAAIQIVKSGKLKALGVTSKTRIKAMPEVPAIADDFAGYEIIAWYGFLAPAGTPRDVVNKVHADVVTIVKRPDFQERLVRDGIDPIANTPEEFASQIKADLVRWSRIVKASGATLD
jgi:tripartite-type tricarboxylate transporter receptor subunit TctC